MDQDQKIGQLEAENDKLARALQFSDGQLRFVRDALDTEQRAYSKLKQTCEDLEKQLAGSEEQTNPTGVRQLLEEMETLHRDIERYRARINKDAELIRTLVAGNIKLRDRLDDPLPGIDDAFLVPADNV